MGKQKHIDPALLTIPPGIEALATTESFDGASSLAAAGHIMMARHAQKLYSHLPGVLEGSDPHDIHQMRVATRRLRASLQATAAAYDPELVSGLNRRLRRLARALGEVRDRDVLIGRLRADAEPLADADGELASVIARLEEERATAHAALVDELNSKRTNRLLRDLNQFLGAPLSEIQAADQGLPLLVRHYAGSAMWREYEAVRRFETFMPDAGSEGLHQLRIACKHLRYTLELFEPALGEDVRGLIKQATAMQEHLGQIHDADVALSYFETAHAQPSPAAQNGDHDPAAAPGDAAPAEQTTIAQYLAERGEERAALRSEVAALWKQINSDATRRKLAKVIAAL